MDTTTSDYLDISEFRFSTSRPRSIGFVIEGPPAGASQDYLHDILLSPENRDSLLSLIETEGLVVCKNVRTNAASYRKVRGKSSQGKLSQAEYYHHDGCSCPQKPRIVEIRLPYQNIERSVATAIASFPDVVRSMLTALPPRFQSDREIARCRDVFSGPIESFPPATTWDKVQGYVTRLVRREMDAESCRSYFRDVDQLSEAYVVPWEMGESRLILNDSINLARTMQHRRSYQKPRHSNEQNGSLVKRWTAEEV